MMPSNCFYIDSATEILESRLFGYAYTDDSVIFGSEGLRLYLAEKSIDQFPREGRFAGIFCGADTTTIRTDATGQELLYLYQSGTFWAVSNSFMLLVAEVSRNHNLEFYEPAAMNFHLKQGKHIGEQLVSHKTMVRDIRVVPIGHELRVRRIDASLSVHDTAFTKSFELPSGDHYENVLIRFLERSSGLLGALAAEGLPMNLGLSGGYDSRLVLALLLQSGATDSLRITSHKNKIDDFRVATSLSERFGLKLNQPSGLKKSKRTLSGSDSVRLYLMSCGGTYLPFYPVSRHRLSDNAEINLTGDQPSGLSFLAGRAKFNGSITKIANDIERELESRGHALEVKEDFLSTFTDLGLEADDPVAPLAFYSAVRARHHAGRSWYKSLGDQLHFTPLMHSDLIGLDIANSQQGFRKDTESYGSKQKLFADAFSAFGGWVLDEPFENDTRKFDSEMLDSSPFKGGVDISPWTYRVFGSIATIGESMGSDSPGSFSTDLDLWTGVEGVKENLAVLLDRSGELRSSTVFSGDDIRAAREETSPELSLSHQSRRLSHVVSVTAVKTMIS